MGGGRGWPAVATIQPPMGMRRATREQYRFNLAWLEKAADPVE